MEMHNQTKKLMNLEVTLFLADNSIYFLKIYLINFFD